MYFSKNRLQKIEELVNEQVIVELEKIWEVDNKYLSIAILRRLEELKLKRYD